MSTADAIAAVVVERLSDPDDADTVSALAVAVVDEAPIDQHPSDALAEAADVLREMGDMHADVSGSAEDVVDRHAPEVESRAALVDVICYLQEKEGGDTWGLGQELLSLAVALEGAARDLASPPNGGNLRDDD